MVRQSDPEKRKALLEAALTLFVERGVAAASTAAIAREAGTAAGTLFLYFPTKQDLIDGLVMEISREQAASVTAAMTEDMKAREMFFTIWNRVIAWFRSHPEAYRYIQLVRDSGIISEKTTEETGRLFGFYYQAIGKGLQEQAIRDLPPELVGEILYRDIVAVMNLVSANPDTKRQEDYIQLGFDIFWKGIGGKI